jgi:hypothetical protein
MYYKTMNKKLWIIVGGVLTAAVMMASIGAIAVYAQSPTPAGPQGGSSNGTRGSHLGPTELAAAAQALGMTTTDLSSLNCKVARLYRRDCFKIGGRVYKKDNRNE